MKIIVKGAMPVVLIALIGYLLADSSKTAAAFPPFKEKEGVPCRYCHLAPNGGKRNYRGIFYAKNEKTFAGFDDVAEAKNAGVEIGPSAELKPKSWTPPVAPVVEESAELKAARKKVAEADTALAKNPQDKKLKKEASQAYLNLGKVIIADTKLLPDEKYPQALKAFRTVLKNDSGNKEAARNIKTIEEIYKKSGQPVPKEGV